MGAFLYLNRKTNAVYVGITVALSTFMIRLVFYFIQFGNLHGIAVAYLPEMIFYVMYGMVFQFIVYKDNIFDMENIFVIALFGDFFSNVAEITLRVGFLNQPFNRTIFPALFAVALVRALILVVILKFISLYRLLLIKEEHESRYQRLLHMTMLLKDEMYWFEKNKSRIESSMANAYHLFEALKSSEEEDLAKESLSIAGDIHEIKKEYELVLRGFKELTEVEYEISKMKYSDITRILKTTLEYGLDKQGKQVEILYQSSYDFSTSKHFELMSVLRNLISNSIDAIVNKGTIQLKHSIKSNLHTFVIEDTGSGIDKRYIEEVFNAGYSTKIDYGTGKINRGLGLSLVKEIVEQKFNGSIEVESQKGKFTKFSVIIHRDYLED
jgi:two-component system sensor histidine kinase YcbA